MHLMAPSALDNRLITILDRLAYEGTTGIDLDQSVRGYRSLLHGKSASELLSAHIEQASSKGSVSVRRLREVEARVQQLQAENAMLRADRAALEKTLRDEVANLEIQLDLLQEKYDEDLATLKEITVQRAIEDDYSYDDFMKIVRMHLGKQNGFGKLLEEYSKAHYADQPDRVITEGKIQSWRRRGSFPFWVVEQLKEMPTERTRYQWSAEDIEYLVTIVLAHPDWTDAQYAAACSETFGHQLNVNSIKSKFNILRKEGRIPERRRGR
jgi:hypothetical protein